MIDKSNISWGDIKITLGGREITEIQSIEYKEPVRGIFNPAHSKAIDTASMAMYHASRAGLLPGLVTIDDYAPDYNSFYNKRILELAQSFTGLTATIKLSAKAMRKLLKSIPMAKKVRLPRKRKKMLKKAIRAKDVELIRKLMPKGAIFLSCDMATGKDYLSTYHVKI